VADDLALHLIFWGTVALVLLAGAAAVEWWLR